MYYSTFIIQKVPIQHFLKGAVLNTNNFKIIYNFESTERPSVGRCQVRA